MEYLEWIKTFIFNYPHLEYVLVFVGAAFGGEVVMIAFGFLLAQGLFSIVPLLVLSFFGTLSSDILYFLLGRTRTAEKFFTHRYANNTVNLITEAVRKISRGSHFIALFLANFMLASRIIIIMYVSKTNITLPRFVAYESVSLIAWLVAILGIGYISGIGYTYLSDILENIYAGIGFVLLVIILIIMGQLWLKRYFAKEGEEILEEKNMIQ